MRDCGDLLCRRLRSVPEQYTFWRFPIVPHEISQKVLRELHVFAPSPPSPYLSVRLSSVLGGFAQLIQNHASLILIY